jgi:hypothetical protein
MSNGLIERIVRSQQYTEAESCDTLFHSFR